MDAISRLELLSSQMNLEPAEEVGCSGVVRLRVRSDKRERFTLSQATLPNGKRINLLKTLLTSACERNCFYCPFRAGRDFRRASFTPEEFARLFMDLHRAGLVQGIFLSSGVVAGGVFTQDKLLDTAEILRNKLGYRGYIHLKIMPGAERDQVEHAMRLADRVSINLEAPNTERLRLLAPGKLYLEELYQPLRWVEEIRQNKPPILGWNNRWCSSTTQFVVGGAGESDFEIISTSQTLYRQVRLGRIYFSAFNPIPDTPLENHPATSPRREHRLYQASFLLRDYGYEAQELPFDSSGNLPLETDPKLAWAKSHLADSPVELNRASRQQLLRIPGIGPKSAQRILDARRREKIKDLSLLSKMGINVSRAAPFILLNGKRPVYQTTLF